jgi:hypothetical protein
MKDSRLNPDSNVETANLRLSPLIPEMWRRRTANNVFPDNVAASFCHQRRLALISGFKAVFVFALNEVDYENTP